ncbi:2OG-Fe(II) oxygenase [Roseateles sp. DXS20W]|uniref:2OG-Fe(II) oxygenase n=1 Tax=Pelomonas lactea TaxID=3299030 RepID=A0ABW7GR42_9BURK
MTTEDPGTMVLLSDAGIDLAAHRQRLREAGRTQIRPALRDEAAARVRAAAEQAPFRLSVNSGAKSLDLSLEELATLQPEQAAKFTELVHAGAAAGFQYCFDTYRLSDEVDAGRLTAGPLAELYRALNAPPFLQHCRQLADDDTIAFCDAQVTRYRPGHFLTMHNDDVAGKGRVMAFVLNLTPDWRADWGGLLLFHGADGNVDGGFTPAFNALNLFKIPCDHSVSLVAPFAPQPRYAVTGWARRK